MWTPATDCVLNKELGLGVEPSHEAVRAVFSRANFIHNSEPTPGEMAPETPTPLIETKLKLWRKIYL